MREVGKVAIGGGQQGWRGAEDWGVGLAIPWGASG